MSHPTRVMRTHPTETYGPGMSDAPPTPKVYRVSVRGELGATALGAFPALSASMHGGLTVLSGSLCDQAALYGVLGQIESLGLELVEVRCID